MHVKYQEDKKVEDLENLQFLCELAEEALAALQTFLAPIGADVWGIPEDIGLDFECTEALSLLQGN